MEALRSELGDLYKKALEVMPGKGDEALLAFTAVLCQGHILIEDVPGMGKTTLVRFLARVMGFEMKRVQFTNDLLPGDILGVSVYRPENQQFHFRPGPIFAELLLADELNRAPAKTQSALLQAMEERVVTVEGVNHPLPAAFTVMATQNPRGMAGTFPLPESQLDRFLMKFPMGLPPREAEKALLAGPSRRDVVDQMSALFTPQRILAIQKEVATVKTSDAVLDYVLRLLEESRRSTELRPLSPRAGLDVVRASRAWAWTHGRDYVLPEDVQHIFAAVVGHRLPLQEAGCAEEHRLGRALLAKVPVI